MRNFETETLSVLIISPFGNSNLFRASCFGFRISTLARQRGRATVRGFGFVRFRLQMEFRVALSVSQRTSSPSIFALAEDSLKRLLTCAGGSTGNYVEVSRTIFQNSKKSSIPSENGGNFAVTRHGESVRRRTRISRMEGKLSQNSKSEVRNPKQTRMTKRGNDQNGAVSEG